MDERDEDLKEPPMRPPDLAQAGLLSMDTFSRRNMAIKVATFRIRLDHRRKNILSENVLPILDNERNGSGRPEIGCKPDDSRDSWGNRLPCWRYILCSGALRNDDVTGSKALIRLKGG
jgi:hypothetical protein